VILSTFWILLLPYELANLYLTFPPSCLPASFSVM